MKRILIIANNDVGLYKFRKELITELTKENEVYLLLPYGKNVDKLIALGAKFIDCPYLERRGTNPFKDIRLMLYFRKNIRKLKPDAILTYTIKPNIYGGYVARLCKIPYIVNVTGLGTALENEGILQKITSLMYKVALKDAKKIFFQNQSNQDFMLDRKIIDKSNSYEIIPGSGVNLQEYQVKPYPKQEQVKFAFVSRIMKQKGIDQYLAAAKYIKKKYPEIEFHIYGFCEEEYQSVLNKLHAEKIINYHGMVQDMQSVYKEINCLIHPTYYPEGMSNVLLEACASGRPIITTDRPGCREIVDDGVNGFVVVEQNSKDLTDKIEQFLHLDLEQREKMGIAARKKVEQEFDRQIIVSKYLAEIQNIR
ncbi:glycosyltransferase family 4 protein [Ligilactobacillus salivarius]|uniref:glycosyltransferase family 4 protein n=1 Tax=Ligilactobacillus salivarius TaxID=1624 RepID=UPI0034DAD38A